MEKRQSMYLLNPILDMLIFQKYFLLQLYKSLIDFFDFSGVQISKRVDHIIFQISFHNLGIWHIYRMISSHFFISNRIISKPVRKFNSARKYLLGMGSCQTEILNIFTNFFLLSYYIWVHSLQSMVALVLVFFIPLKDIEAPQVIFVF